MTKKILVLEDDPVASRNLEKRLGLEGYIVDVFDNSIEAVEACDKENYSLLILDVTIHGSVIDGVEAATLIRKKHKIPSIFVTSSLSEEAYIRGYNTGALAYIPKPFSYKALALQIKNILDSSTEAKPLIYKNYSFDVVRNTVKKDGEIIHLTKKQMGCISYLVKNKGRVVSKKELSDEVWPGEIPVTDDVINNTITRIRKELGKDIVVTHRGQGYEIQP